MTNLFLDNVIVFTTLFSLELALGVDNIISIYVLSARIKSLSLRKLARRLGVALAAFGRLILLFSIAWLTSLTKPLFVLVELEISWRDVIFFVGGAYLLYKGVVELYALTRFKKEEKKPSDTSRLGFGLVIFQILMLDLVFSLDSIITAVALTNVLEIMILAIILAVIVMVLFVNPVCEFVDRHPDAKIIALLFLAILGLVLMLQSIDIAIDYNYLYAGLGFSLVVMVIASWSKVKQ